MSYMIITQRYCTVVGFIRDCDEAVLFLDKNS